MSDHCPRCATFGEENGAQHLEIVGYQAEILHLVREKNALKRELANARHAEPLGPDITAILKLWRALCSTKRSSIELDGDRAKVVRAALKSKVTGDRKQRRRTCMEAVRGLSMRPYVVNAQRIGKGKPDQRYADIEHALKDEKRIEEHAAFYRMAQAKPSVWAYRGWEAAMQVDTNWMNLYRDALHRERLERTRELIRTHPERVTEVAEQYGLTFEQLANSMTDQTPSERPKLFVVPDPESEAAA